MSEQDTSGSNSAPDRNEPTAQDVMRTGVPTIAKGDSVARVARVMADAGVPGLVVMDNGKIAGIITESDLVTRQSDFTPPEVTSVLDAVIKTDAGWDFDDEVRRALAMSAADLMSHPVYSIRSRATLGEVATLMHQYGVNPVPVVDDSDRLVGMVSRADIVRVIAILEDDGSVS